MSRKDNAAMYTHVNFKTKAALKAAVAEGKAVTIYQPNDLTGTALPYDGKFYVEGPHYPQPHRWYAEVWLKDGNVVKVR